MVDWDSASRLALLLVLGLAVYLRCQPIAESLWLDELHTAWTVADGFTEMGPRARVGNTSALYFFLPWLSTRVLGMSEYALRIPSVLVGTALVVALYYLVVLWTESRIAGLMGATLAAIDPNFLFYSVEARAYALVQLLGLVHIYLLWQLTSRPSPGRRMSWIVVGAGLFYLHYTTVLLIPAEIGYVLCARALTSKRQDYRPTNLLVDLGVLLLLCLPAVGHLSEILQRRENWSLFVNRSSIAALWSIYPMGIYILVPTLAVAMTTAISRLLGKESVDSDPLVHQQDEISRSPQSSIERDHDVGRKNGVPRVNRAAVWLLTVLWLFVPITLAWLLTDTNLLRVFLRRYVIVSAAAPIVLACLIVASCRSHWSRTIVAMCTVGMSLFQIGPLAQYRRDGRLIRHSEEDWASAVNFFNEVDNEPHIPIFVRSGLVEADVLGTHPDDFLREYCLLPIATLYRIRNSDRPIIPLPTTDSGRLSDENWRFVMKGGEAWFFIRGNRKTVKSTLTQLSETAEQYRCRLSLEEQHHFGLVSVVHVAVSTR